MTDDMGGMELLVATVWQSADRKPVPIPAARTRVMTRCLQRPLSL